MLTSIRDLIKKEQLNIKDTVYQWERKEVLDFKLTVGDFFKCVQNLEKGTNYSPIYEFAQTYQHQKETCGILKLEAQIEKNQRETIEIKKNYQGEEKKILLKKWSEARRALRDEIRQISKACYEEIQNQYGENLDKLLFFEYKNRVLVTSFDNITKIIPKIAEIKQKEMWNFPWLTTNLTDLVHVIEKKEELGIVGGPCLFGIDEVLIEVETLDGNKELFDLSCGRRYTKNTDEAESTLKEYLIHHKQYIKDLHIINRKTGITRQEYISLLYVFEFAHVLNGKVVIPLPDLSYIKYIESDIAPLDNPLKARIIEEFKTETFQITDIFLELIDVLKKRYPDLFVTVLHKREEEVCRVFYERREPFLRDSSYMRKLTNISGKADAVIDYITMLALPYYIYDVHHIIQIDSLDETDSGRKCQKIHMNKIHLHSMLYPEFISRDGLNTIYSANFPYKDYLEREDY